MKTPSVAVVKCDFHDNHSTSWSHTWLDYCKDKNIPYCLIDWREYNAYEKLVKYDIVLWHFSHYSHQEMIFARNILNSLKAAGCRVYPDNSDADHFDDKIAQSYLLGALGLPTPTNYSLHSEGAVEDWISSKSVFPVVAKLRAGSGAHNVKLIKGISELRSYSKKMFKSGFNSKPSLLFKVSSNLGSTKSWSQFLQRVKRAPEFFFSKKQAGQRMNESGYVYLQEFIPKVPYDLKIVVVGDKLSFFCRGVRKEDFRASGSGDLFYDHSLVTKKIIDIAFHAAEVMGSDCAGFDIITDPRTGLPVILEVSYGFSHTFILEAGGFYSRDGSWHEVALNAPQALLEKIIDEVSRA